MNMFDDQEVKEITKALKTKAAGGEYIVSDLVMEHHGKTLQFVDLVMEGGGTLGIALIGYIYALEQAGVRFLSVGGSSVGAIATLLLASLGKRTEEKGEKLANIITDMNMGSFVDGSFFPATLSRLLGSGKASSRKLLIVILGILSSRSIFQKLGLNTGDKLLEWLMGCLAEANIHTLKDLREVAFEVPENLVHRHGRSGFVKPSPSLKLIAADITTSTKANLPEMSRLYWEDPDSVNPAHFARASVSIPGFFQPMVVHGVRDISGAPETWKKLCSFEKVIPRKITFSDGGLLSNFPISLFHQPRVPDAPTFGARLGTPSRSVMEITTVGGYLTGMFNAMSHYSDYEFIHKNPDYRRLVAYIPTTGHNWLNFNMSDAEKLALFKNGMNTAYEFLEKFDWEGYKKVRSELLAM